MTRLPMRGRLWRPEDRTGGPLDEILDAVRQHLPGLVVARLQSGSVETSDVNQAAAVVRSWLGEAP